VVNHGRLVVGVLGSEPPAMSVAWERARPPLSGFTVIYADADLDDDADIGELVCIGCLLEHGDEQLGRGLDLAREHRQVDWDEEAGEWFVPDDAVGRVVSDAL